MDNTTPLNQHKRKGKKLIPPLLEIPNFQPRSWINDALPEYLWAVLLITQIERSQVLEIFRSVVNKLSSYASGILAKDLDFNIIHTGLSKLKKGQLDTILEIIFSNEESKKALRPLLFYPELPAYKEWERYLVKDLEEESWKKLKIAIGKTLWHQSQEATDCRWLSILFYVVAGKMHMPHHLAEEIIGYPNVGDIRKVRPSIRASEIFCFSMFKTTSGWTETFWKRSLELTGCEGIRRKEIEDSGVPKEVRMKINTTFKNLVGNFFNSTKTTAIDPRLDTTFGICFYMWRLVAEIVFGRTNQFVLGRLGIRSLAECYIVLSHLIQKDDEKLWQTYRAYGLGQIKLAVLKYQEVQGSLPEYIDAELMKAIANEDAWQEFVAIDLGHWDNLNLRTISVATGTKEIYNKYYSWPSNYSHGQWGAVREVVFQTCLNPLHRLHRIPYLEDKELPDGTADALFFLQEINTLVNSLYPYEEKKEKK